MKIDEAQIDSQTPKKVFYRDIVKLSVQHYWIALHMWASAIENTQTMTHTNCLYYEYSSCFYVCLSNGDCMVYDHKIFCKTHKQRHQVAKSLLGSGHTILIHVYFIFFYQYLSKRSFSMLSCPDINLSIAR